MTLMIMRVDGRVRVAICHGGKRTESREFRRLSHRAWGYIRRRMAC